MTAKITIGPILFYWSAEDKLEFYKRIAEEDAVDTVYIGEIVCGKRVPFFEKHYDEVITILQNSGKKVVLSTLSEVMIPQDRKIVENACKKTTVDIEANDVSALLKLSNTPHRIGQLLNVYNEDTLETLAKKGAYHFCLPSELPADSIEVMGQSAKNLNVDLEVQVFGRMSLALSARCYHARAYDKIKANCQFVCEHDSDGMDLNTIDDKPFLSINGIQTLSYNYLNLINELDELQRKNITHFRISPHSHDISTIINSFNDVINDNISTKEAMLKLQSLEIPAPFSNGFYHKKSGYCFI